MTKKKANRKLVAKGHKLGEWIDLGVWKYAECLRCDRWVAINAKGEIVGPAVQIECGREKI